MILGIDTSRGMISLGLAEKRYDRAVISKNFKPDGRFEVELLPAIEDILKEADLEYRNLTGISATTGPGRFTGLRLGLSCALGLSDALNIPLLGVSCFHIVYSLSGKTEGKALVMVAGSRGWLWCCKCDENGMLDEPFSGSYKEQLSEISNILKEDEIPAIVTSEADYLSDSLTGHEIIVVEAQEWGARTALLAAGSFTYENKDPGMNKADEVKRITSSVMNRKEDILYYGRTPYGL